MSSSPSLLSSSSSSLIADNYHLKWDSHLTNLNASITTIFKNEKFADVMLVSSHPTCIGGPAIPAHKIILSSSSNFFSAIFSNHLVQTGLMYIMLPPELSYRCIKILVQYMYSGQATVPNNILNEVLRGGEILKIRGLYKSRTQQEAHRRICTPNSGINNEQSPKHLSPLPMLPKESPVVITLPNKSAQKTTSLPTNEKGVIFVKKNIAVDPEVGSSDNLRTTQKSYSSPSNSNNQVVLANKTATEQNNSSENSISSVKINQCAPSTSGLSTSKQKFTESQVNNENIDLVKKSLQTENLNNLLLIDENNIKKEMDLIHTIKAEPMDWNPSKSDFSPNGSLKEDKPPPTLIDKIKIEGVHSDAPVSDDEQNDEFEVFEVEEDNDADSFTPLECEICEAKFTLPKDWVRHVETHMETTVPEVPKKKQKIIQKVTKEIEEEKLCITCDLCSINFEPGDWVRHMKNVHPEKESDLVNKKLNYKPITEHYDPKKRFDSYICKTCDVCNESFPTYAKMIIHYRTHFKRK